MNTIKSFARKVIATSLLLTASSSLYAAVISMPENLEITTINGQSSKTASTVELSQGRHLLEFKYDGLFEANADDTDARVLSGRLYLPLELSGSSDYRIEIGQIYSEEQAREFISNPTISLLDNQGNQQSHTLLTQNQLLTNLFLSQ